jgi:hypothetical protein
MLRVGSSSHSCTFISFWVLFGSCWWTLVAFWLGCCLLWRRTPSPCHRRMPVYDLGSVSALDRLRCPCFVVGFHLPFVMCLGCCLFLGKVVWRRSFCLFRWFVGIFSVVASLECYGDVCCFPWRLSTSLSFSCAC